MHIVINILGVVVFLAIAIAFSKKRREIHWRTVGSLLIMNLVLAWFLTQFFIGREIVKGAAQGFTWLVNISYEGIAFAFPDWVHVPQMNFFTSALLPILMVVPLFDIFSYIGLLPFIIRWVGRALAFVSHAPKFEAFFSIEMMFLGNTEALAVSKHQLQIMKSERNLTLAMMSMSCVTASLVGVYIKMMPPEFILIAVPLNVVNALIVSSLLNPVNVPPEEDVVAKVSDANENGKKEPFFSFLGTSILGSGRLVLIIAANVIAFVSLAAFIDHVLALFTPALSLESILGVIMFPFAWLMGLDTSEAFQLAQYMGTKLVTNEFVVMLQVGPIMDNFSEHMRGVMTVFMTSFANFSTLGMVLGAFRSLVSPEKGRLVPANALYLILSGILVSLLSAAIAGLFIW